MSLDWVVAFWGARGAAGNGVMAFTIDGVYASPFDAPGEGEEVWGVADCVMAGEIVAPFTSDCKDDKNKGGATGCAL